MQAFSHGRGLIRSCRKGFLDCRVSKTKPKSQFLTKITFWDVKVIFSLLHFLLTPRIDLYHHQKYVRYFHSLGVKTRSLVGIYHIILSVRRASKLLFLNPWDIFSSIFWSIFLLSCCFPDWKYFLNPTYSLREGHMCPEKWQEPWKKSFIKKNEEKVSKKSALSNFTFYLHLIITP